MQNSTFEAAESEDGVTRQVIVEDQFDIWNLRTALQQYGFVLERVTREEVRTFPLIGTC